MKGRPSAISRSICAAAICAGLGFAGQAHAQAAERLREGLFGELGRSGPESLGPPVARYVAEDGEGFTLDRSQPHPLLKFDGDPEIWVLQPHPAPRGDVIYKNDAGEPVLRATRLGGLTVFTARRPEGEAAALEGEASPIRLATLGPQALAEHLLQASARASRAARRLIPFDADASPRSSGLIADAAMIVSEAVIHLSRRADASSLLSRLRQVRLVEGRRAEAQLDRGVLQVTVSPAQGIAWRPSSERIEKIATDAR